MTTSTTTNETGLFYFAVDAHGNSYRGQAWAPPAERPRHPGARPGDIPTTAKVVEDQDEPKQLGQGDA